jgi:hypothetical protein
MSWLPLLFVHRNLSSIYSLIILLFHWGIEELVPISWDMSAQLIELVAVSIQETLAIWVWWCDIFVRIGY